MEAESVELAKRVLEELGSTGTFVLAAYTKWELAHSIAGALFGVSIWLLGWGICSAHRKAQKYETRPSSLWSTPAGWWVWLFAVLGFAFVASAIPGVVSPEAGAISKLITQLR